MASFFALVSAFYRTSALAQGSAPPQPSPAADMRSLELIRELGFAPLGGEVRDFELPDVDGAAGDRTKLSKFRGNWLVLVFWATWCPACNQELPILEGVHKELASQGLVVLGVATDSGATEAVKRHLDQKGVTFTNLHDANGAVAASYEASSIPTLYLISPDFKVVGLVRGVIDLATQQSFKLWQELLPIKDMAGSVAGLPAGAAGTGGALVPADLAPPQLKLIPPGGTLEAGAPQLFKVEITWRGDSARYLVKIPKVTLPAGVSMGTVAAQAGNQGEQGAVTYTVPLSFEKAGEYQIGPIELAYGARAGGGFQSTRLNALAVKIEEGPFRRSLVPLLIGLAVMMASGGLVYLFLRQRTARQAEAVRRQEKDNLLQALNAEFENLRRLKIKGSGNSYDLSLLTFADRVAKARRINDPEWQDLNKFLEKVKYAGYRLDRIQTERLEQKIRGYLVTDATCGSD
jgi:peroxiredoxin